MGHVADDQAHCGVADVQASETQILHIPQLTTVVTAWENKRKMCPESRSEKQAAVTLLLTHLEGSPGP